MSKPGGKGSGRRPSNISMSQADENWVRVFRKKEKGITLKQFILADKDGHFSGENEANNFCKLDIFTQSDDRTEVQNIKNETLMIFTADCKVNLPDGTRIGTFWIREKTCEFTSELEGLANQVIPVKHHESIFDLEVLVYCEYHKLQLKRGTKP